MVEGWYAFVSVLRGQGCAWVSWGLIFVKGEHAGEKCSDSVGVEAGARFCTSGKPHPLMFSIGEVPEPALCYSAVCCGGPSRAYRGPLCSFRGCAGDLG